jgi:hypothetical protein
MPLRLLDLVVLATLVVLCVRLVPAAFRILQLYRGIGVRRLADGSTIAPPPTLAVALLAERLGRLGFERIGERTLVLPDGKRRFEWDLVDRATTTYAAIVPAAGATGGALLACYSAFADGGFVATTFPRGATVERRDFLATSVSTSPEEAVAAHARRIDGFSRAHGQPLANRSMADLLARDATYRMRHGGATLRRRVYGTVGFTALVVVAMIIVLARVVFFDR